MAGRRGNGRGTKTRQGKRVRLLTERGHEALKRRHGTARELVLKEGGHEVLHGEGGGRPREDRTRRTLEETEKTAVSDQERLTACASVGH